MNAPHRLDTLVTDVATMLMAATSATSAEVSREVLAELVETFGVDVSFLRYNDHSIRATKLVAEWPARPEVPDPDPLGVVYFADADPIFAAAEHAKEPVFFSPEPVEEDADDYQRRVAEAGYALPSLASVPLLSGDVTTGALGFIKFGIKDWSPEELNALKAIASLFAQVQARVVAEDQLRYLAEHDDLTGLSNGARCSPIWTSGCGPAGPGRCRRCSSTSTGSRPSTTTSGTTRVTGSSGPSPSGCGRRPTRTTSSPAWVATSSAWCPPRR